MMIHARPLVAGLVGVLALVGLVGDSHAQAATPAGASQPPDTRSYVRSPIPADAAVARRAALAASPSAAGPTFTLLQLTDVNTSGLHSGSEPSLAVDPEHPNTVVVHAGFQDWDAGGQNCASLFVSTNGGASWSFVPSVDRPTNIPISTGPNDATLAYGANSVLFGSFLTQIRPFGGNDIFTGSTLNPTQTASFSWHTIFTGLTALAAPLPSLHTTCSGSTTTPLYRAQLTDQIATHGTDQPWVVVHSHRPDPIILGGQSATAQLLPIAMQNDVYVAYADFSQPEVPVRVAVSPAGATPPNFTVDKQVGTRGSGGFNPGHRLAVAPRTVFRDGTTASGLVYSLHQRCVANCSGDAPLFDIVLNRTADRGATWNLNGNADGMVVAQAASQQPTPKFGTANALFGGIDHLAVDPSTGMVYVVYGVFDRTVGHNRLALVRLFYQKCDEFSACNVLVADPPVFVDDGQSPAALPAVAVTANGTLGVLYDTFEGTISGLPVFVTHLAVADGHQAPLTFNTQSLLAFLSPAPGNSDPSQRVLGDYQQMLAIGNRFYGVFTGTGAAFGHTQVSSDPIFFVAEAQP